MSDAVIVSAARSPIGRAFKGSLTEIRPDELASQIVTAALSKVPELDVREIDDLIMGCGKPGGEAAYNIGRAVAVRLGYDFMPGTTVNRYCSSSLQTSRMAFHAIKAGEGDAFISAGVESVSRSIQGIPDGWPNTHNDYFSSAESRTTTRSEGGAIDWQDPRDVDAAPDLYIAMGQTAENVALLKRVSREDMDHFAVRSHNLAEEALDEGFWDLDITPIVLPNGDHVSADDGPRLGVTYEAVSHLKPVFRLGGSVTAGNCCPLNDGAAALIIMSDTKAKELGITPLARILSTGVSGLSPEIMGLGPVEASQRALDRAGMTIRDIDLVEINEAFASQVLASQRGLGVEMERLNVNGGAIALGHPFGMTGARITTTLLHSLQQRDKQIGLETMCVGGGQGMALIIERMS